MGMWASLVLGVSGGVEGPAGVAGGPCLGRVVAVVAGLSWWVSRGSRRVGGRGRLANVAGGDGELLEDLVDRVVPVGRCRELVRGGAGVWPQPVSGSGGQPVEEVVDLVGE